MTSLYSCSHCAVAAKDCCRTEIISVPLARNTLSHSLKRGVAVRSRTVQGPGLLWNSSATRATARFPQLVGIARMMRELRSPAAKPGLLSVHISRFRHRIYIAGAYKAAKVGVASGPPRVCSCRMAWHRRINGVRFVVIAHSQHRRAPRRRVMQAPCRRRRHWQPMRSSPPSQEEETAPSRCWTTSKPPSSSRAGQWCSSGNSSPNSTCCGLFPPWAFLL